MFLDFQKLKLYIETSGIKQKALSKKTGISEVKLSMSLQGKRKIEAGEYAAICNALNVPMTEFMSSCKPLESTIQVKSPV